MGSRYVPAENLRIEIINMAHQSHCGRDATKKLIKTDFWWPQMDDFIENVIATCNNCLRPSRANKLHKWDAEQYPWQRIHMD